jgi:cell division protease FtsH
MKKLKCNLLCDSGQSEYNFSKPILKKQLELLTKKLLLIESQYQRAIQILEENKDKLNH